jgi:uncharacterized membrane protein YgcG
MVYWHLFSIVKLLDIDGRGNGRGRDEEGGDGGAGDEAGGGGSI